MNLKYVLQSKRSQTQKAVYIVYDFIYHTLERQNQRAENRPGIVRGQGSQEKMSIKEYYMGIFRSVEMFYT